MVDGGAVAKSMFLRSSGIGEHKGVAAEGSAFSTVLMPGPSEKIRRTVTRVERYRVLKIFDRGPGNNGKSCAVDAKPRLRFFRASV